MKYLSKARLLRTATVCKSTEEAKHLANLRDIAFHVTSFLRLQGQIVPFERTNLSATRPLTYHGNWQVSHKSGVNAVQSDSTSRPSAFSKTASDTPVMALDTSTQPTPPDAFFLLIVSLDALLTIDNALDCRVCLCKTITHRSVPSFSKTRVKFSRASAISSPNSCLLVRILRSTDQFGLDFAIQTALMERIPLKEPRSLR